MRSSRTTRSSSTPPATSRVSRTGTAHKPTSRRAPPAIATAARSPRRTESSPLSPMARAASGIIKLKRDRRGPHGRPAPLPSRPPVGVFLEPVIGIVVAPVEEGPGAREQIGGGGGRGPPLVPPGQVALLGPAVGEP